MTDVFLDELAEAALQQLQHFTARQLATLAYNYGTLNHWARNDQELLDAITIRMLHQHAVRHGLNADATVQSPHPSSLFLYGVIVLTLESLVLLCSSNLSTLKGHKHGKSN